MLWTYPDKLTQDQRFAQLGHGPAPIAAPLTIHWQEQSIPFVEAQNEADLAFGVGVVHAHLRIDQIELLRLAAQGRLSEVAGPIPQVAMLDRGVRMLDLMASARNTIAKMSPQSRQWMENFTAGLNWYIEKLQRQKLRPVSHKLMGRPLEALTLIEVIAISRLISADLSWGTYFRFLKMAEKPGWKAVFERFKAKRESDSASYDPRHSPAITRLFRDLSRSGSNSVVIAADKSHSKGALIASDPHVGIILPNFWLLVGMYSPQIHALGLMIPGVPIVGEGRNAHIAWGGTNMRGISSHLYDVSDLPPSEIERIEQRLPRRFWWDKTISFRQTAFGPILSDLEYFDQKRQPFEVALDWVGRHGSDDIGAFLQVAQAQNFEEFKQAFADYRVSAMNMLYADAQGNIGMVAAYGQPQLSDPKKTLDLVKSRQNPIQKVRSPLDLPLPYNPPQGFLASANNKPFAAPEIPISFSYSTDDRFLRISSLVKDKKNIKVDDLKRLQLDHFSASAQKLQKALHNALDGLKPQKYTQEYQLLFDWDANFNHQSQGAVVFEAVMSELWRRCVEQQSRDPLMREYLAGIDNWKPELQKWIQSQTPPQLLSHLQSGLALAHKTHKKYRTWGELTVFTPKAIFGWLPVIGKRFSKATLPISGSADTLNKYGRKLSAQKTEVSYGATARHISDMSSLDENYFVLNGGQDAWIFNEQIDDQIDMWNKGEYIKVPLSMSKVRASFSVHKTKLVPETGKTR